MVILLCTVPLWLLVSGGLGIWGYFRHQEGERKKESARYATAVSASSMADDFRKLTDVIGVRHPSVDGGRGLTRAASWIEGLLGPSNTGYKVQSVLGPEIGRWPILRIDLRGTDERAAPLWIVAAYDTSEQESSLQEASSALVAALSSAQAIAGEKPVRPVRFVFLPSSRQPDIESALLRMIRSETAPWSVLGIGPMHQGDLLSVSAADGDPAMASLGALGAVGPAPAGASAWLGRLSGSGLPFAFIRSSVTTESGSTAAGSESLAASTGRLVELIRRLMTRK